MLENYTPILLFILFGIIIGAAPLLVGALLAPHKPNQDKNEPFECGFPAFEDARLKFNVKYYLVAILFIIFDLEIAFLFPWAINIRSMSDVGFGAMFFFLGLLAVGFAYEWLKGALDWE